MSNVWPSVFWTTLHWSQSLYMAEAFAIAAYATVLDPTVH
jgi:hypothetical protein